MYMGTGEGRGMETCQEDQLAGSHETYRGTSGSQSYWPRNQIFQGMENQIDLQMCEPFNQTPKADTIHQKASTWRCKETSAYPFPGIWKELVIFYVENRV